MDGKLRRAVFIVVLAGVNSWSRGETLTGVVTTAKGAAAAGAKVWVARLSTQRLERVEAQTDDRGRYSMEVGPGRWIFGALLGDQGLASMDSVEVAAGRPVETKALRLARQGRLRGRLIEAETGKPIAGGRFVIDDGRDPVSDKDGRFEAAGLSKTRSHEAFVVAPGRERKRVLFEMAEGPITDLDVLVPRGGKVAVRVLDLEGRPIADAAVGRSTSGSILSLTGLWEHTDEHGELAYDGLVLDRTTWLNAEAPGYTGDRRSEVQLDTGEEAQPIEFRLVRNQVAPSPASAGAVVGKADAPPGPAHTNMLMRQ